MSNADLFPVSDRITAVIGEGGIIKAFVVEDSPERFRVFRPSVMGPLPDRATAMAAADTVSQGEFIRMTHEEANEVADAQAAIVQSAGTILGKLAIGDYKHWNGPRGASSDAAIDQAVHGLPRLGEAIARKASEVFQAWCWTPDGPYGRKRS